MSTSPARPPIWVISLERAADRRAAMVERLTALGIDFELVDAVDGAHLAPDDARRYSRLHALFSIGRGLGWGEIGCALSHVSLYERMVRDDVPIAVIMEDDAIATPHLTELIDAVEQYPPGWDVMTLHSLFPEAEPVPLSGPPLAEGFVACTYRKLTYGAQCYVITRAAARRLLDVAFPLRIPADDLVFRELPARLAVYGVHPNAVDVANFPSELVERRSVGDDPAPKPIERPVVIAGKVWRTMRGWGLARRRRADAVS